jgi:type II secretory pathway pseudopilin PulG
VLLVVAVLSLAAALAHPSVERARLRRQVDAAAGDVEAVRAAALRVKERTGAWPAPTAGARALPPELVGALSPPPAPEPPGYRLTWRVWEVLGAREPDATVPPPAATPEQLADRLPPADGTVRAPPAIARMAAVVVHTADARVLEELLARYRAERSFVRDSTWTLLLGADESGG